MEGPVGRRAYAHRTGLRIGTVALFAVIFVFWDQPTAVVVIVLVIFLLLVLGLIELIGRRRPNRRRPTRRRPDTRAAAGRSWAALALLCAG